MRGQPRAASGYGGGASNTSSFSNPDNRPAFAGAGNGGGGRQVNKAFLDAQTKSTHIQSISHVNLKKKFQQARATATLNLSSCQPPLQFIPKEIFQLDAYLEEGEKFWEIEPLRVLDISSNAITQIPEEVGNLVDIHTFKARNNQLTGALPERLFEECVNLKHMDFAHNRLTEISESVNRLTELKEFLLNNNQFTFIPNSILTCQGLRVLDLSHNQIEVLPITMTLPLLLTLNLSHNKIRYLPQDLTQLTALEGLYLASNQLTSLPDLSSLTNLKTLDVSQNQLSEFPKISTQCKSLQHLILSYNRIPSINMELLRYQTKLTELLIHNNALQALPNEIEYLTALKVLDVSNNDISDLPATLGYMTNLQILKLEGNCIKTIRQTLIVKPTNELKTYLRTRGPSILQGDGSGTAGGTSGMGGGGGKGSGGPGGNRNNQAVPINNGLGDAVNYRIRDINGPTLNLSNLQLTDCPDAIVETMLSLPSGPNVTSIDLSTNMLTEIPRVFVELPQIKSLNLSGNKLQFSRNMVSSGSPSTPLQSLDVSHNQFPSGSVVMEILFHQFPRLQELIMNHNTMTSLPMSLNRYPTLTSLKVSHCHLTDVTCLDFRQLHGLKVLDFGNNKLTALPETLPYAANLEFLSIENNEFREIPTVLGVLPALKTLLVAGNPQRLIRPNIIQSGSAKVIEWLKTKYVPTENSREDRMMPPEPSFAAAGGERRGRDYSGYDNADAQIPPRPMPAGYQQSSGYSRGIREREDVSMTQGHRERNVPVNRGYSDYPPQECSRDDRYNVGEEMYDERRGYVEESRFANGGERGVGGTGRADIRGRGGVSYDDEAGYDSRVDMSRQVAQPHSSYQPRSRYVQSRLQPEPTQPVSYGRQSSGAAPGYQENNRRVAASTNYSGYGDSRVDSTFEAPVPATSRSRAVVARGGGNTSTIGDLLGSGGDTHSGSAMTSRGRVQRTETLKTLNSKRLGDYASGNR